MIKDEHYVTIQGWMRTQLGLKGNELLLYAILYGFSQASENYYRGSKRYLADWMGTSQQSVINNLKSLIEKGHVKRWERIENGVTFPLYQALPPIKIFEGGIKNFGEEGQDFLPNNLYIENNNENIENKDTKRFIKPTVDEVQEYCEERNNHVDPERFWDYYESKGWKVGKTPMKDWRAAVRNWERGDRQESGDGQKPMIKSADEYEEMFDRNIARTKTRMLRGGAENFND